MRLLESAPHRYDLGIRLLSLGQIERVYDRVAQLAHGPEVLDLGCGTGNVALRLARRGVHVIGVDLSPEMLDIARQKTPRSPAVRWLEAGAVELWSCPEHAGFLSNVATVLKELAERLDPRMLVRAAEAEEEVAYAQRLGYLLDRIGHASLAAPLAEWIRTKAPRVTPLRPDRAITGAPRASRWRVTVNELIEMDQTGT